MAAGIVWFKSLRRGESTPAFISIHATCSLCTHGGVRLLGTDRLYEQIVSLPTASDLTHQEVAEVIAAVREFAGGGEG